MEKRVLKTTSAQETMLLGKTLARRLREGGVLLLFGDLGSGKTTFTQGFAKELGIEKQIISPTFLIMRSYEVEQSQQMFYHMDLYRISSVDEIEDLGIQELFDNPMAISVVEWAEKLQGKYPEKRIELHFRYIDEHVREIEERMYGY